MEAEQKQPGEDAAQSERDLTHYKDVFADAVIEQERLRGELVHFKRAYHEAISAQETLKGERVAREPERAAASGAEAFREELLRLSHDLAHYIIAHAEAVAGQNAMKAEIAHYARAYAEAIAAQDALKAQNEHLVRAHEEAVAAQESLKGDIRALEGRVAELSRRRSLFGRGKR